MHPQEHNKLAITILNAQNEYISDIQVTGKIKTNKTNSQ
jgi:hypothetical protein